MAPETFSPSLSPPQCAGPGTGDRPRDRAALPAVGGHAGRAARHRAGHALPGRAGGAARGGTLAADCLAVPLGLAVAGGAAPRRGPVAGSAPSGRLASVHGARRCAPRRHRDRGPRAGQPPGRGRPGWRRSRGGAGRGASVSAVVEQRHAATGARTCGRLPRRGVIRVAAGLVGGLDGERLRGDVLADSPPAGWRRCCRAGAAVAGGRPQGLPGAGSAWGSPRCGAGRCSGSRPGPRRTCR